MSQTFLMLEASTDQASVALVMDGRVAAERAVPARHAETGMRTEGIVPAIVHCLTEAKITSHDLSGVICSGGPGGFTSLRTAASIAKGICFALRIPLYAVPTLELIVADVARDDGVYVAALDAGREEYYASFVTMAGDAIASSDPVHVLSADALRHFVADHHAKLVGPVLGHTEVPRAGAIVRLLDHVVADGPVALETWEPAYGRLAEAQAKWEATHGRPLSA